jgi:hypothetical protein
MHEAALKPGRQKEANFIKRYLAILKRTGILAKADETYGMRVGPGNESYNIRAFKDRQNRPDFDKLLVERVRDLFY